MFSHLSKPRAYGEACFRANGASPLLLPTPRGQAEQGPTTLHVHVASGVGWGSQIRMEKELGV